VTYWNVALAFSKFKMLQLTADPRDVAQSPINIGWSGTAWGVIPPEIICMITGLIGAEGRLMLVRLEA